MKSTFINSILFFSVLIISCGQAEDKKENTGKDSIAKVGASKAVNDSTPEIDGVFEKKYPNGNVSLRGEMRSGKREGTWFSYYQDGQPMSQSEYVNGIRSGKSITWYSNGQKRFEGAYTDDKQTGVWKYWEENGKLAQEVDYDKPTSK